MSRTVRQPTQRTQPAQCHAAAAVPAAVPAAVVRTRAHPRWPLIVWAFIGASTAQGQTPAQLDAPRAAIATGTLTGATGGIAVNQTAGIDNVQANQAAIATGATGPASNASLQTTSGVFAAVRHASVAVEGNAFSNASGLVALNQSAGVANLQRNSVSIGAVPVEAELVSDRELSATSAATFGPHASRGGSGGNEAVLGAGTFHNVTGVVQINQTAGAGNVTANSFVLRPPAGTFF